MRIFWQIREAILPFLSLHDIASGLRGMSSNLPDLLISHSDNDWFSGKWLIWQAKTRVRSKMSVLNAFCVCKWGTWGEDGSWMPRVKSLSLQIMAISASIISSVIKRLLLVYASVHNEIATRA